MLTLVLLGCLAVVQCAPTEQAMDREVTMVSEARLQEGNTKPLQPLREFLILTPDAQLQLQPALKLQQSVVQPLTLYGTASSTRQFENICNQIQQGVGTFQEVIPIPLPWFETSGDEKTKQITAERQRIPEINSDAETIPQGMLPRTPAIAVPTPEHRFYTVAGRPQFFGNVDILQNPLHPIFTLQPLQTLKQRSIVDPVGAAVRSDKKPQSHPPTPTPEQLEKDQQVYLLAASLAQDAGINIPPYMRPIQARKQAIQAAGEEVAQKFASRFDADQSIELKKEGDQAVALNSGDLPPLVPAAKLVESSETAEETNSNQYIAENVGLELQQTKTSQDEDKPASVEK